MPTIGLLVDDFHPPCDGEGGNGDDALVPNSDEHDAGLFRFPRFVLYYAVQGCGRGKCTVCIPCVWYTQVRKEEFPTKNFQSRSKPAGT